MKTKNIIGTACLALLMVCLLLFACAQVPGQIKVRVLIVPKFEIGKTAGDYPGEAQLFYEQYCADCEEVSIPNAPSSAHFYMNESNGVGLLVTGCGKTAAGLSLSSLLSWDAYDFSNATIVSVGCGGGSTGLSTLGDVVVVTAACDAELGHRTDVRELEAPDRGITWFPDDSYKEYAYRLLNPELCENAYQLVKDCPLRTTETAKSVLADSYSGEEWATRDPHVAKGAVVTGDCYWKGRTNHDNAVAIAEHYDSPDLFKLFTSDVGLLAQRAGISLRASLAQDTLFGMAKGTFAEQYVCQQLFALGYQPRYWQADNSSAELDFVIQADGEAIPIEVKSGLNLRPKSLKAAIRRFGYERAIRFSVSAGGTDGAIRDLPLYAVEALPAILSA